MMKYKEKKNYSTIRKLCLCFFLVFFSSCVEEATFDNTPQGNFDALWKIIDEQYCFLDYKKIDWDSIHTIYQKRITADMTNEGLFQVLGDMLAELKDGHVNLYSANDVARYWKWYEDYPMNFSDSIQKNYIGTDYHIAAGIKYTILKNNIGYIYYESFSDDVGSGNLDEILNYLAICDGLIIDVRNNGGGTITNATKLAERFTNEKVLTGYICHKTGKGHSDFSEPYPIYLEPSDHIRWQKKVVIITNRHTFSATNDFVNSMNNLPLVTIIGDKTGGGSGLPFSSELPNGWSVRFSSSPTFASDMSQIEWGIDPDKKVDITTSDYNKGIDTIIESACTFLKE